MCLFVCLFVCARAQKQIRQELNGGEYDIGWDYDDHYVVNIHVTWCPSCQHPCHVVSLVSTSMSRGVPRVNIHVTWCRRYPSPRPWASNITTKMKWTSIKKNHSVF